MKKVKRAVQGLKGALLTHMRAVAYAPVSLPTDSKNHAQAMAEAADKRSRKNAERLNENK